MHNVGLALAVLLAACAARAQPAPPAGDVRSLQGTEDTQTEARAETDVPGTVTAVEAGAVTVRAAGADLRLEVPPARAGALRPGTAVTLQVVLIARAPAPGTPGGGPAPPNESAPGREVRTPARNEAQGVHPEMTGPRPDR